MPESSTFYLSLIWGSLRTCLIAAPQFLLSGTAAIELIEQQITVIRNDWSDACKRAELSQTDRSLLWGRQFLNPYAFEDLEGDAAILRTLATEARTTDAG